MRALRFVILFVFLTSCGVAGGKTLGELDDDQKEKVCKSIKEETATCDSEDIERTEVRCQDTLAQISTRCSMTVKEYRDCGKKDLCEAFTDPDCLLPDDCFDTQ